MLNVKEKDIHNLFSKGGFNDEHLQYLEMHAKRLAYAVNVISEYKSKNRLRKLLDIGPHFLTRCIHEYFPDIQLHTLGWKLEEVMPGELVHQHIQFDPTREQRTHL